MKTLEERALEARAQRELKEKNKEIETAEQTLNNYKKEFPEIERIGKFLYLGGHEFIPSYQGYIIENGSSHYSSVYWLRPTLNFNKLVYDLASFGDYLIWFKNK